MSYKELHDRFVAEEDLEKLKFEYSIISSMLTIIKSKTTIDRCEAFLLSGENINTYFNYKSLTDEDVASLSDSLKGRITFLLKKLELVKE